MATGKVGAKHELLTRDEMAERFGVDVRTITNWVADGMPQRSRSGKPVYAWGECFAWHVKKVREDARANREAGGDEERKTEIAELKLRTLRAEAEAAELTVAERRGELVTVAFMRDEFARMADGLRAALLSIPAGWEGALAGCVTAVDRQLALQDLVNELLPLLGAAADDDGEDGEDGEDDNEDDAGGAAAVSA